MPFSSSLISFDLIMTDVKASSKKQSLQAICNELAPMAGSDSRVLLNTLMDKERQSSSGTENGIAIPHLQSEDIHYPVKALVCLKNPVDFETIDEKPVDIISLILSPISEGPKHLRRLARTTRLLSNPSLQRIIREVPDIDVIERTAFDIQRPSLAA